MCFNISGKNLEPETLINSRKECPEYAQLKWKQDTSKKAKSKDIGQENYVIF